MFAGGLCPGPSIPYNIKTPRGCQAGPMGPFPLSTSVLPRTINLFGTILRRLLAAIPTLLLISVLSFGLMRFHFTVGPLTLPNFGSGSEPITLLPRVELKQPIDPLAALQNNPQLSREAVEKEKQRLGLTRPVWEQYFRWLGSFLRLDLGKSFSGESVFWLLTERAGATLLLNLSVLVVSWAVGTPLGVVAAMRVNGLLDYTLLTLGSVILATPSFILALVGALIAAQTGLVPVGFLRSSSSGIPVAWWQAGADVAWHLILPVTVLSLGGIASLQRQVRASLLENSRAPFVRAAIAKGLPDGLVWRRHILRISLNPMATLLGYEFAGLLAGSVLVEIILQYPGLGLLTYEAVLKTDTNLVMASLMLSAAMLLLGNLLGDLLLSWLDPRIRHESAGV
jgi:peptide/nickel transport system permease protein